MADSDLSLSATVKYPEAPYLAIKRAIIGKAHRVSLTFVGETRARRYNQTYRGKSYVPNVLSFPLDEHTGEIVICPAAAYREAKAHQLSLAGYITYLFIHGLLHLKGYDHGDTMHKLEARYRRQFCVK